MWDIYDAFNSSQEEKVNKDDNDSILDETDDVEQAVKNKKEDNLTVSNNLGTLIGDNLF